MDKRISFKSGELFYRISGKNRPVILLHGFGEDGTIFENQINALKEKNQLIIPDLPGSGRSDFIPGDLQMEDYAQAVIHILDEEKLEKCMIIGHSMGGYITLAIAEKHPERLSSFGLFHSSAYADDEEKKKSRLKSISFIQDHGSRKFLEESIPKLFSERFKKEQPDKVNEIIDRYAHFQPEVLIQYTRAMMNRPDRTTILKDWKQPILMIIGEEDNAVPLTHSLQQSHLPKLCYIHIAKDTGHMGMLEDSVSCNKIIQSFLDSQ